MWPHLQSGLAPTAPLPRASLASGPVDDGRGTHTPVLLSVAARESVEMHSRSHSSVTNLVPMRSGSSFLRGVLRYLDAGDLREEHVRVEIRVVGPAYGAQFRIHACLGEERGLAERLEHAGELNHLRHVNCLGSRPLATACRASSTKAATPNSHFCKLFGNQRFRGCSPAGLGRRWSLVRIQSPDHFPLESSQRTERARAA